jgi:hypothetical protein
MRQDMVIIRNRAALDRLLEQARALADELGVEANLPTPEQYRAHPELAVEVTATSISLLIEARQRDRAGLAAPEAAAAKKRG